MSLVLALAPFALNAEEPFKTAQVESGWVTTTTFEADPVTASAIVIDSENAKQPADFAELRSHLDGTDRALALNALQVALSELGDGVSLVWKRESRELTGVIKPVSAFRDDSGRVCRHLTYSLALGTYVKEVEGIACRESDGKWSLQG